ncbi:hypothetical protein [Glaciecola sp. 1036]|uniref:hypothetical protein n=1 Tax=Alteromonadaceae TaxID=72275 RepID=UPI003D022A59
MMFKKDFVLVGTMALLLTGCATPNVEDIFTQQPDKDYSNMYLRGVFNWWEASDAFKLRSVSLDEYAVVIELIADGQPYDFKVADSGWANDLNCGVEYGQQTLKLDDTIELYCAADSANLQFTPSETGNYRFVFDVSDNDEPELTIIKI